MRFVERENLEEFARRMGERLVELSVRVQALRNELFDDTLETIAQNCPNLKTFRYNSDVRRSPTHGQLSERGPNALIQNCSKLQLLHVTVPLEACPRIDRFVKENSSVALGALSTVPRLRR